MEDLGGKSAAVSTARAPSCREASNLTGPFSTSVIYLHRVVRGGGLVWRTSVRPAGLRFCGERQACWATLDSGGERGGPPHLAMYQRRPA